MASKQTKRSLERLKEARQRREKKVDLINELRKETQTQQKKGEQVPKKKEGNTGSNKKIRKVSTKSLALATKQLASMVKTGLPIVEALSLVAETTDDKSLKSHLKRLQVESLREIQLSRC